MSLVNSTLDFTEQHVVTNGASELIAEVFGDAGKHARSAFGVAQIPLGACVEIERSPKLRNERSTMPGRLVRFKQVDVFTSVPFKGNALAGVRRRFARRRRHARDRPLDEPVGNDVPLHADRSGSRLPRPDSRRRANCRSPVIRRWAPRMRSWKAARAAAPGRLIQQCGVGRVALREQADGWRSRRRHASRRSTARTTRRWLPRCAATRSTWMPSRARSTTARRGWSCGWPMPASA